MQNLLWPIHPDENPLMIRWWRMGFLERWTEMTPWLPRLREDSVWKKLILFDRYIPEAYHNCDSYGQFQRSRNSFPIRYNCHKLIIAYALCGLQSSKIESEYGKCDIISVKCVTFRNIKYLNLHSFLWRNFFNTHTIQFYFYSRVIILSHPLFLVILK